MNVNEKGNKGLIKIIEDLYEQGFSCFLPFDDFSPIDCIATRNEEVFRLQIKYRTKNPKGRYEIVFSSVVNGRKIPVDFDVTDYWVVYLADIEKVIYLDSLLIKGKKSLSFSESTMSTNDIIKGKLAQW